MRVHSKLRYLLGSGESELRLLSDENLERVLFIYVYTHTHLTAGKDMTLKRKKIIIVF